MPELPEVETVARALSKAIDPTCSVSKVSTFVPKLRTKLNSRSLMLMLNKPISKVRRRGKYLLFDYPSGCVLSHLGMSGSWRLDDISGEHLKHDHLKIQFENEQCLIYNDPRRFGLVEVYKPEEVENSKWLRNLGREPLSRAFSGEYLKDVAEKRKTVVKSFLMDQKVVVGVGNIYAAEALFESKIRPYRKVSRVSPREWKQLSDAIKRVLRKAIRNQGTTFRDFRQPDGKTGKNSSKLFVYGRWKQACLVCGTSIAKGTEFGRSSFWCTTCQK